MRSIKNHNITQYVALYNKGIGVVVPTFDSLTKKDKKKIVNYLVVPNNFVLSPSLSLSSRAGVITFIFFYAYARAKRGVTVVNKGLLGVSFVRFFVPVCELSKKQNKDVLSTDFITIIHCNSLINFVFTHQCFRQAAVICCLPVEGGEGRQSERINNEFVRMYI